MYDNFDNNSNDNMNHQSPNDQQEMNSSFNNQNSSQNFSQQHFSNSPYQQFVTQPYLGGSPVECPRCKNISQERYCFYCGLDLSKVYTVNVPITETNHIYPYYCNNQKRNSTAKTIGIIISAIALFVTVFFLSIFVINNNIMEKNPIHIPNAEQNQNGKYNNPNTEYINYGGVSVEEYEKIKIGMTYAHVSQIIGGDGQLVNSGENLKGEKYVTFGWAGENDPSAVLYVTFTNDQVSELVQENLAD